MDKIFLNENVNSINKKIDTITTLFYQNSSQTAYENVQSLLNEVVLFTTQMDQLPDNEMESFNQILLKMMLALEEKDGVLLADILRYELKEKVTRFSAMI